MDLGSILESTFTAGWYLETWEETIKGVQIPDCSWPVVGREDIWNASRTDDSLS